MPPTQMRQQSDAILYGCQRTITAQAAFSHALNELVFNHLFQRFGSLGEPQVSGYIISQDYKEGSVVPKGQVLFEIDPRPFKATLDRAKGELGQAEAQLGKSTLDVNRDAPLVARKAVPKEQLDTEIQAKRAAEAKVESAKAAVERAELDLAWTKVTSLVDGVAGIAQIQMGNLVGPTSQLTSVSQVDPIKVPCQRTGVSAGEAP